MKKFNFDEMKTPEKAAPMYYTNIIYNVLHKKGKSIRREKNEALGVFVKGDFEDLKNSSRLKKKLLFYYFGSDKKNFKKVESFELKNIEIKKIDILHFQGYGIK